jgi:putative aldouronate transport system substrate-binding protein
VDQFDAVYDAGMADYLASGGQAIIDERAEKLLAVYGEAPAAK